ncbi:MAG: thiamine pyrophosphate-dependent enzyme [Anaerolineae bacterium]|nr:thiamine pyrophosphate-dependent enzyme [Anaerolineae bacterium]
MTEITGSQALAYGALDAGVQFVTGYPGSPSTATVDALLRLAGDGTRIEWASNEKSAFDAAFGASLAGIRSLLCLKSVGLNVALDSLMVSNLAPGDGAFVILVGDDPGGWGSQNEEDSRLLAVAAEVPLLEPVSASEARGVMRQAFELSERFTVPVVVRITRALAEATLAHAGVAPAAAPSQPLAHFQRRPERFNVLPAYVVDFHRRLQTVLSEVERTFEQWPSNRAEGQGQVGIVAAGFARQKLAGVLAQTPEPPPLQILALSSLHPLPGATLQRFLSGLDAALVLEETAPYLEIQVQALAQRAGLGLAVYGRTSGHVPGTGEVSGPEIVQALAALLPDWPWPGLEGSPKAMPSRQPLCDGCPYIPTFESLLAVMERHGGRQAFIVTGETGCMVRAQLPPLEMMDLKYGMGSSIGLAAGLVRAGVQQRVIALSGDSAFLHSGLSELIDSTQAGVGMLVVILANETTALSGGQPHPATARDARGRPRPPIDLVSLVRAAGVDHVRLLGAEHPPALETAFEDGLACGQLAVVIVQQPCARWAGDAG